MTSNFETKLLAYDFVWYFWPTEDKEVKQGPNKSY